MIYENLKRCDLTLGLVASSHHLISFLLFHSQYYTFDQTMQAPQAEVELICLFRKLHSLAEPGLQEYETSAYLRSIVQGLPNVKIDPPLPQLPTAIIARLNCQSQKNPSAETWLFRCELDALRLQQPTDAYAKLFKKEGIPAKLNKNWMHACGHDGHMAALTLAAKHLSQVHTQLKRNIIFCYQPGQEGKGGANKLLTQYPNLLSNVTHCFALHISPHLPTGTVSLSSGEITSHSGRFNIVVKGKSAHVMLPQLGIDANYIGCSLVTQLYGIINSTIGPLEGGCLSIVSVQGGSTNSSAVISDRFQINGTVRTCTSQSFNAVKQKIQAIATNFPSIYNASSQLTFTPSLYRPVFNNPTLVEKVEKHLQHQLTNVKVVGGQRSMAGQDFCQFSERVPSCYITVGAGGQGTIQKGESKYPAHSSRFKFDTSALQILKQIWISIALSQL